MQDVNERSIPIIPNPQSGHLARRRRVRSTNRERRLDRSQIGRSDLANLVLTLAATARNAETTQLAKLLRGGVDQTDLADAFDAASRGLIRLMELIRAGDIQPSLV